MYSLNSQNFSSNFFREMVENASKTKKKGEKRITILPNECKTTRQVDIHCIKSAK